MFICLLCMQNKSELIKMSSKKGKKLNCSWIIAQHFWLKPNLQKNSTESVCLICWDVILAFHQLYQFVAKAHNYFECEVSNNFDFLEPEVKLDIENLGQLPNAEVIENVQTDNQNNLFTQKQKNCLATQSKNSIVKEDISKTMSHTSDADSETEIPLSMLKLNNPQKTETDVDYDLTLSNEAANYNSTNFEVQVAVEKSAENEFSSNNQHLSDNESNVSNGKRAVFNDENDSDGDSDDEPDDDVCAKNKNGTRSVKKYNGVIAKFFKKLECFKCKSPVENYEDLRKHFKTVHNSEPFIMCCGRKFHKPQTLYCHVLVHLNPKHVKCSQCHKILQNDRQLKKHIEKYHQCHQCMEVFENKKLLRQHQVVVHLTESDHKFTCTECGSKFSTKSELRVHEKTVHDIKTSVICDKCGQYLSTRRSLRRHRLAKHPDKSPLPPDPVQCDICGKWLKHRSNLRQHKNWLHEQHLEQECPICKKIVTSELALGLHMRRMHESKREFPCTMCEKVLKTSRELREHINIHTKEKQYTCEICYKNFDRKASMVKHTKIFHTGEPTKLRVKCEFCNVWLHSSHYLKKHIKIIHEKSDVKYPCPICSRESVNEIALKKHITRNHGSKAAKSWSNSNIQMQ